MSDAIPRKRSAAKTASKRRAAENKENCSPSIRFYEPNLALNESRLDDEVSLKVKADVDFTTIKTFMLNGPLIVNQRL